MKRTSIVITAALVAALAVGAMAGCSGQSASSASASASASAAASTSASASASAATQSQDELKAELEKAIANVPAFKSVTVHEEDMSALAGDTAGSSASASSASSSAASTDSDTIAATTTYKFDESSGVLKTSTVGEIEGIKLQYVTEGDNAVFVSDGPVYSGTVEQFGLTQAEGFKAYLESTVGDLSTLAGCVSKIEKMEAGGLTFYMLTLDPQKYMESDEALKIMAESGDPVKQALSTIGFDEDGSLASVDLGVTYEKGITSTKALVFSDYNSTAVEPMPAADKTYEEMEADMQAKIDELAKEMESAEGTAEAK